MGPLSAARVRSSSGARIRTSSRDSKGPCAAGYTTPDRSRPYQSPAANLPPAMGSLIKKRRKRMRKKKHKKLLKRTRWQRRAAGK